ncbi:MAG TPA: hypothetical protein ENJ53_09170 [Phaeodactylibacter sp.]|nr:hypothetical protein [Phaeodactylibacter sp.]
MKKQILNFTLLAIIALIFGACKNDHATTTPPPVSAEKTIIGSTGIPDIDKLSLKIAQDPKNAELYAARAEKFYQNEGYDNAIQDMASAMKIDSTNADYHHLLADIYLDYYKSRLALQTMKRCVALYPKRMASLFKLAEIQQILKQYDASMATVVRVMKIDPDNPRGFFMIGVNHALKGNKKMAIKNLQKCVDIDPEYTEAWVLLGQIFEQDNDPLALQYFENAVETAPDNVEVLYSKASYLHNHDQLDKAEEVLKKIIKINRQYPSAFDRLGVIYLEKDSIDKAYENFNIAVNIAPDFGVAYYHRGYASELKGDLKAAKRDYQNILNFNPDSKEAKEGMKRVAELLKK